MKYPKCSVCKRHRKPSRFYNQPTCVECVLEIAIAAIEKQTQTITNLEDDNQTLQSFLSGLTQIKKEVVN